MMSLIKSYLKVALAGKLPGESAHRDMLPPGRRLDVPPHEINLVKNSGVLVLLFPENDKLYTCLTRRPASLKHHPGQISFPGGKVEKQDLSALWAAMREAREEVGIDPQNVEILGKLSDLYVHVSQFKIHPFVGWTDQRPDFLLNDGEVEKLVLFPVMDFLDRDLVHEKELMTVTGPLMVPYFSYDGEMIWGATAMILSELFELFRRMPVLKTA